MFMLPLKKHWYLCPICGKRLFLYHDAAVCRGLFIKCRECRNEIEIKI